MIYNEGTKEIWCLFCCLSTLAWEKRQLGEVLTINSGRDYKHLEPGKIPVYGTGGFMLSVSEALSAELDGIGIGRKGTIDKPFILRAPYWTVDTLFYCIPREMNNLNFLYSIFTKINWKALDESTGVPSLSKLTIKNVNAKIPSHSEQTAIGTFFSQLDRAIALQERTFLKK
ncbi:restriction endonuclease subunit S [Streptococcus caprae]|uniref:Restriction endonuclease subunit S n=1 Tax=Streptococcus caprae TaxID=1640501 RepID=A0ABV8CVV7_9STRE